MQYFEWIARARKAERNAHSILSVHESAASRIVLLEDLLKKLSGAPIDVQEYFKESIRCLEYGLLKAAIVFSWAGHFEVFSEYLFIKHEVDIRNLRKNWSFKDLIELKEQYSESQILDVSKDVAYINRAQLRLLQGQLSQRNQCAHPTLYKPSVNVTIGYVDGMVSQSLNYMNP
ncbi:hypothetical protein [Chlorobium ferrooxidans]|uniref:hypothetical protein n=1 Tax=Chlorobium ferrooxidans TaxID=84205 RepID=UPI00058CC552|nr:hypothetical protein [Chlorobium ferrooxidans]